MDVATPPLPPPVAAMVYVPFDEVVMVILEPAVNPIVDVETNAPPFARNVTEAPAAPCAEQVMEIVPEAERVTFVIWSEPEHVPELPP